MKRAEKGAPVEVFQKAECESVYEKACDWQQFRRQLLDQISAAARHCLEVEQEFGRNPPPELETLIKLHRVLILQLSTQTNSNPETARLVTALMKPVMDWARLQEHRKERELAEAKYRDQVAAQKAALEREVNAAKITGGLSPQTLENIERELKLM